MARHELIQTSLILIITSLAVRVVSQDIVNTNETEKLVTDNSWNEGNWSTETTHGNLSSLTEENQDTNSTTSYSTTDDDDEDRRSTISSDTSISTSSADEQHTLLPTSPVPCDRSFCRNHGECVLSTREDSIPFHCSCDDGYIGKYCEIQDLCNTLNDRLEVDCKGGACVYNEQMTSRYCACFYGEFWDPDDKECKQPDPPCFPNPCKNGGTCKARDPANFNCSCPSDYTGSTCAVANDCGKDADGTVCGNGICKFNDLNNKYSCECFDGYYRHPETRTCERVNPPCEPDPCSGNGICTTSEDGSFNCTCNEGYIGEFCQITDQCKADDEGNRCVNGVCAILDGAQLCICNDGYSIDEITGRCIERKPPCVPNPCENAGYCNVLSDDEFNCSCPTGFSGELCSLRNRCELDGGQAFCGQATCSMDYDNDVYYCSCPDNEYFNYRSRTCKRTDFCPLMTCEEDRICEDSSCVCADGFKEDENGICKADFCTKYGCPSEDMICQESSSDNPEDFKCSCKPTHTFNGTRCVPAVCLFSQFNNCSQICAQSTDGFKCDCEDNFVLNNDSSSCDDEGVVRCVNSTCSPGVCIIAEEGEMCICPAGYVELEGNCVDVCSARRLPPGICPENKCVPDAGKGGFRCLCDGKFEQSEDGVTCTIRKMCRQGEIGWDVCTPKGAECIEDFSSVKGYRCQCPTGFEEIMKYGKCERICDNPVHQKTCSTLGAVCEVNERNEAKCRCPPGFRSTADDGPCTKLAEVSYFTQLPISIERYRKTAFRRTRSLHVHEFDMQKLEADISDAMKNLFEAFTVANVLKCESSTNGMMFCKVEIQFKEFIDEKIFSRIQAPRAILFNETISEDTVLLPPSLVLAGNDALSQITFARSSLCDEDIKTQICGSETTCIEFTGVGGFACTCGKGFELRQRMYPTEDYGTYIETCKDVDECAEANVCPPHSHCINTIGSYECSCLTGYRYTNESAEREDISCVALCDPNPCMHGDCVRSGDHKFECKCRAGYAGPLCDFEDRNYKAANARTIIVGAVLGGVLLVAVILFTSTVSRLRRKKHSIDPSQILYSAEMIERRPVRVGATNTGFERD